MKSNPKTRKLILITLGILFVLLPIFIVNFSIITDINNKSSNFGDYSNLEKENLKISEVSGRIHIDNNWTAAKSAGICTGNGTYSEPYVIEDLVIDAGDSGSCIKIENSNVYFKIENCSFYNSEPSWLDAGIRLSNVENSLIITNNCSSNFRGIYLSYSYKNTISGNILNNNTLNGIYLWESRNNTISGNNASNNDRDGIFLSYSNNNTLSGNNANNNDYAIYLTDSNYNNVSGNTVNNNRYGMYLADGVSNNVSGNTANNNQFGINLWKGVGNNVSGNTVNNNHHGIHLARSNNNTIRFNIIEENDIGIYLRTSYSNEISNNTFNGNNVDFQDYVYVDPKSTFRNPITIVIVITAVAFSGTVFVPILITRKRSAKNGEIKSPGISEILAIISSITCLVGGFFYLWSAPDLPYFSPIFAVLFGVMVIIGAFIGLKFKRGGPLLCLVMGIYSVLIIFGFSIFFLFGAIFIIIGSIVGLIGAKKKKGSETIKPIKI